LCVNPGHIEVVTHEENQRRKVEVEVVDGAKLLTPWWRDPQLAALAGVQLG
jgi:hypothetical protein